MWLPLFRCNTITLRVHIYNLQNCSELFPCTPAKTSSLYSGQYIVRSNPKFVQSVLFFHFDCKMNAQSIFIASSIICLTFCHVVSTEKYPYIGKCYMGQAEDGKYSHLTFICDRSTLVRSDCFAYGDYTYSVNNFYKSTIRKLKFENCVQPTIFDTTLRYFYNVNDLDISHMGMTIVQMGFLAEPNNLTKIDASHNNNETILMGNSHNSRFCRCNIAYICIEQTKY